MAAIARPRVCENGGRPMSKKLKPAPILQLCQFSARLLELTATAEMFPRRRPQQHD
jgi:hypothetical protein